MYYCSKYWIYAQKLAQCGTDGRLLLRAKFFQVQIYVTQKVRKHHKSSPIIFRYCPCQLSWKWRTRYIVKMEEFLTFNAITWPWPWIWPYGIPSCITHRPLPTYQISFESEKRFVDGRTYERTYIRTDGHRALLGRLGGVELKMDVVVMLVNIDFLSKTGKFQRFRETSVPFDYFTLTKMH